MVTKYMKGITTQLTGETLIFIKNLNVNL